MIQYVLQIKDDTQQLIKSYVVTQEHPIRPIVPDGRTQIIITDGDTYNQIIVIYAQYTVDAKYSEAGGEIICDYDGNESRWIIA